MGKQGENNLTQEELRKEQESSSVEDQRQVRLSVGGVHFQDEYFEMTAEELAYQKLVGDRVMAKLMGVK